MVKLLFYIVSSFLKRHYWIIVYLEVAYNRVELKRYMMLLFVAIYLWSDEALMR